MYLKASVIISFLAGSAILFSMFPSNTGEFTIHNPENTNAVVVELFTSQGCSSCPAADKLLSEFIDRSDKGEVPIYGLSFHVDYWNRLGWKDPYSAKAFTERQYTYADRMGKQGVYTPQMIVNGTNEFVGSSRRNATIAINGGLLNEHSIKIEATEITRQNNTLKLTYSVDQILEDMVINIALVERGILTDVSRGENRGKQLHHDNVVRAFEQKTLSKEGKVSLNIPKDLDIEKSSIILYTQEKVSYEILGATKVSLNSTEN